MPRLARRDDTIQEKSIHIGKNVKYVKGYSDMGSGTIRMSSGRTMYLASFVIGVMGGNFQIIKNRHLEYGGVQLHTGMFLTDEQMVDIIIHARKTEDEITIVGLAW